jgi:hypothetical protein
MPDRQTFEDVNAQMDAIHCDAKGWLAAHAEDKPHGWVLMLRVYADHYAVKQREEQETALRAWAHRYGLDTGDNVTEFLFRLSHETLGEVRDFMSVTTQTLMGLATEVSNLRDQVRRLRGPHQSPEIVDLSNGCLPVQLKEVSSDPCVV